MTGESKPASGAPAGEKPKRPQAVTKAAAAKPPASSDAGGDDETPFDLNPMMGHAAVQLARKPAKGRTFRIVCPMCDTPGFATPEAGGRDVRCANPDCLVPIFTAPAAASGDEKPIESPVESEQSGISATAMTFAVVFLLLAGGGAYWYYVLAPQSEEPSDEPLTAPPPVVAENDGPTTDDGEANSGDDAAESVPEETVTLDEILREAPEEMVSAAQDAPRVEKAPGRQLAARAFADLGRFAEAREQVERIRVVSDGNRFRETVPLAELALRQLEAGDKEGAARSLEDAREAAAQLPESGVLPVFGTARLAVPLILLGREDEAEELLAARRDDTALGYLAAAHQIVEATQSWDFDRVARRYSLVATAQPTRASVTVSLVAHGHPELAGDWAMRAEDEIVRGEALSGWACELTAQALARGEAFASVQPLIDTRLAQVSKAGRAQMLARVANLLYLSGENDRATGVLERAKVALETIPQGQPFQIPTVKELYELDMPEQNPARLAALAAAEIARAENAAGRPEDSLKSLAKMDTYLRTAAPELSLARSRLADINSKRREIENELRSAFKLDNLDEVRRAINNYRRQCKRLLAIAESTAALRAEVLQQALGWYSGHRELQETVGESMGRLEWRRRDLMLAADRLIQDGQIVKAAQTIERFSDGRADTPYWKRHLGLIAASRLAAGGHLEEALEFAATVRYTPWRRTTYRVLAAYAVTQSQHAAVWEYAHTDGVRTGDRIALLSGLIAGSRNARRSAAAATSSESAGGGI